MEAAEQKTSGWQQLLGLLFSMVILGLLALGAQKLYQYLTDSQYVPMSKLAVQGELQYLKPAEVRRYLHELPNVGNFFTLEVSEIQAHLEAMPWIYRASVRKRWPDQLVVFLHEQDVVARWNEQQLLNRNGEVFEADQERIQQSLVNLYGLDKNSSDVLAAYQQASSILALDGFQVAEMHMSERHSWSLKLSTDVWLYLGREERNQRLQRFIELSHTLPLEKIKYIDLRYDTGVAVGWKEEESTTG